MTAYAIPYVTTNTRNGERTVDVYSRLLADHVVYLGTPIDDGVANTVIAQLLHLENESPQAPVSLYINSPGGETEPALAIYDAMQYIGPRCTPPAWARPWPPVRCCSPAERPATG